MGKLSRTISSLCHVAMVIMISGCATHGGKIAYDQSNFGAPDKIAVPQRSADYHLGVGDVVTLRRVGLHHAPHLSSPR